MSSRYFPLDSKFMKDKRGIDLLYGHMQLYSSIIVNSADRYVRKKDVVVSQLAKKFNISKKALSSGLQYLTDIGLICEFKHQGKKSYRLISNFKPFVLIPEDLLDKMIDTREPNILKAYAYMRYLYDVRDEAIVNERGLSDNIGYTNYMRLNHNSIPCIMKTLNSIGAVGVSSLCPGVYKFTIPSSTVADWADNFIKISHIEIPDSNKLEEFLNNSIEEYLNRDDSILSINGRKTKKLIKEFLEILEQKEIVDITRG